MLADIPLTIALPVRGVRRQYLSDYGELAEMFVKELASARHAESGFHFWVERHRDGSMIVVSKDGETRTRWYTCDRTEREMDEQDRSAENNPCRKVAVWSVAWSESWSHVNIDGLGSLPEIVVEFIEFYQTNMAAKCIVDGEEHNMPFEIRLGRRLYRKSP